ncbi:hypothetical protein BDW62DRAFT_207984 [Aspergillus aurantiobrunneus]
MYVFPVSITFVCVATIAVALRLFTRVKLVRSPGWDDWFLLLALLTDYAFFGVLIAGARFWMLWISVPLYNLTLNLTKISMVLLYMRLFPIKTYQILLRILLVLVVCSGLYMVLGTLLMCIPVHVFWDQGIEHSSCVSRKVVWFLTAALQISGDLVLVILPMPQLVTLRIPLRQKICLMLIFALGLFVCATSVARLYSLAQLESGHNGFVAIWSFVETNVAIVCASLPTFRQLILRIFPRILPLSVRKSSSRRSEKKYQDPPMFWAPFQGPSSYSAGVSVSNDHESSSHYGEGIQVVRELRWEMGSAASANENGETKHSNMRLNMGPTLTSLPLYLLQLTQLGYHRPQRKGSDDMEEA